MYYNSHSKYNSWERLYLDLTLINPLTHETGFETDSWKWFDSWKGQSMWWLPLNKRASQSLHSSFSYKHLYFRAIVGLLEKLRRFFFTNIQFSILYCDSRFVTEYGSLPTYYYWVKPTLSATDFDECVLSHIHHYNIY